MVPAGWTCDPTWYNETDRGAMQIFCDCECGAPDTTDCADPAATGSCPNEASCSAEGFCELPNCGDGTFDEDDGEGCDDGNTTAGDGCSPGCQPEDGYSCSADPANCIAVPAGWEGAEGPFCSDAAYGDGESCGCGCGIADPDCADATAESCDSLPLGCIPEEALDPFFGQVDLTLVTMIPDPTDNTACIANVCGDGWTVGGEECDDGNTTGGDGCAADCTLETDADCVFNDTGLPLQANCALTPTCGDGLATHDESCEDGNTASGDGCSYGCTTEPGYACEGSPSMCSTIEPAGWLCSPAWYGADDGCDCGCGIADTDCADDALATCEYALRCGDVGADPADTTQCLPTCENYCDLMLATCDAGNQQYASIAECLETCADFPAGTAGATDGDSLACRMYHLGVATTTDPATHCPHAGPTGDGVCTGGGDMDGGVADGG
jgi:cysteine-rich repeat protein